MDQSSHSVFLRSLFFPSHTLPPILCSWVLPSCPLLYSYISTLLLSLIHLTFINLLLAWIGYRLNHWHLFCFSYNAWKSSTFPTCKGFLVCIPNPAWMVLICSFMDTDWLAIYTVHVQRQLVLSAAFCWEACLHSEPLALIEDKWMQGMLQRRVNTLHTRNLHWHLNAHPHPEAACGCRVQAAQQGWMQILDCYCSPWTILPLCFCLSRSSGRKQHSGRQKAAVLVTYFCSLTYQIP